jgi:UDP-N-acetyl-D-mannosaminuronate dehydrogenase
MAFLKNLGNKIGEVAGDAAEKAKDLAEITKLKSEISGEQKKIQQAFIDLGKIYYEDVKDAEDSPGIEFCLAIKAAQAAIAELEAKINSIKND